MLCAHMSALDPKRTSPPSSVRGLSWPVRVQGLRRMLKLSAFGPSRHSQLHGTFLLLDVKRTCPFALQMSACDPTTFRMLGAASDGVGTTGARWPSGRHLTMLVWGRLEPPRRLTFMKRP